MISRVCADPKQMRCRRCADSVETCGERKTCTRPQTDPTPVIEAGTSSTARQGSSARRTPAAGSCVRASGRRPRRRRWGVAQIGRVAGRVAGASFHAQTAPTRIGDVRVLAGGAHIRQSRARRGPPIEDRTAAPNGGSVSGYHELMTSLTAQRSPATVRRTGSRAVFLYIADRVENSLFCRRPGAIIRAGVSL